MKVGVGGTFNALHRGHRRLLEVAMSQGDELAVGLMSDEYCHWHKARVLPYGQREQALRKLLEERKFTCTIPALER